MDSTPVIVRIADALAQSGLEAILIGNAAAAIHGAPVTTVDFDFLFRVSPVSQRKLRRFAEALGGSLVQPFTTLSRNTRKTEPVAARIAPCSSTVGAAAPRPFALSSVYRIEVPGESLQVDLTSDIHGVRSFNSLRSRSSAIEIEGRSIMVAPLADIINSKRAAGRPRDLAVLPVLEETLAQIEGARAQTAPSSARSAPKRR